LPYIDSKHPNYINFDSAIDPNYLIYSRKEKKPNDFINELWKKCEFVKITKHAKGWYELYLIG
jgi:hypothetical protein